MHAGSERSLFVGGRKQEAQRGGRVDRDCRHIESREMGDGLVDQAEGVGESVAGKRRGSEHAGGGGHHDAQQCWLGSNVVTREQSSANKRRAQSSRVTGKRMDGVHRLAHRGGGGVVNKRRMHNRQRVADQRCIFSPQVEPFTSPDSM